MYTSTPKASARNATYEQMIREMKSCDSEVAMYFKSLHQRVSYDLMIESKDIRIRKQELSLDPDFQLSRAYNIFFLFS